MNQRVIREYKTVLLAPPEKVFPLLCPLREYDWIPGWACEIIFSQSGHAELGCVFTTNFEDGFGAETWVVSHYEPREKIAFVRTGNLRTARYEVILTLQAGNTEITWRQELTGLVPEGNALVAKYSNDDFSAVMVPLNKMLNHYLVTGKMFSPDTKENVPADMDRKGK